MSLLSWAKAGIGIAVLPYSSSLLNTDPHLVKKDIIDPVISSKIYVVWNKDVELSAEAAQFLSLISQKPGSTSERKTGHEIAQTPRRGDEDINAPAERFHLRDLTDPAEDGGASKRKAGSKALKIFKDLDGQFSGRC